MPAAATRKEELFEELAASAASAPAVAALRRLIDEGSDFDCYKLNAFRLAQVWKVPRGDCLRSLLFATRLGILDLNWDIHCPSCHGLPAYHKHLMALRNTAHCPLCEIDWNLDLEEQVEVTFTVNPEIRVIDYPDWSDRDFDGMMHWLGDVLAREGRDLAVGECVLPGETKVFETLLEEGRYEVYMPSHQELGGRIHVEGPDCVELQQLSFEGRPDGSLEPKRLELRPGRIEFTVRYDYPAFNGFLVVSTAPRRNWVSAAHVMAQQDFRALFAGEFLSPDTSFAIRSVSLMFTDITGSTAMYERLGDGRAYATVQEHFKVMTDVIRRHEGGIVKTIGDAVMAVFPTSASAVAAACEIQEAFHARQDRLREVTVKIGIHRGPCIAVTSNRSIDYFGRTVNIAARVQGQSAPNEIVLTPAVFDDPTVQAVLAEAPLSSSPRRASLKGIDEAFELRVLSLSSRSW